MCNKTLTKGQQVEIMLKDYIDKSVMIDINGSISTLKNFDNFTCWIDGADNKLLVLYDRDTEEAVYLKNETISKWGIDIMTGGIYIELDNEITLDIYEQ
jgi:hypothetical protein